MRTHRNQLSAWVAVTVFALAHSALAATYTWSGPSGGDWLTPGNWSPSGSPGTNDEARFFNPGAVADATLDNLVTASTNIQRQPSTPASA